MRIELEYTEVDEELQEIEEVERKLQAALPEVFGDGSIGKLQLKYKSREEARKKLFLRLGILYMQTQKGKTLDDFIKEIVEPLAGGSDVSQFTFVPEVDDPRIGFLYTQTLGCVITCFQLITFSEDADEKGDEHQASVYLGNALYQIGLLEGYYAVKHFVNGVIKNQAKRAGSKRGDKYANLKKKALELAAAGDKGRPFPSRRQAAKTVFPEVWELEKTVEKTGITEENLYNQIYMRWLADMEFGPAKG